MKKGRREANGKGTRREKRGTDDTQLAIPDGVV